MDAPERIMVAKCHPFKEPDDLYVCHPRLQHPAAVEFIRADLCADPALLAEAVEVLRLIADEASVPVYTWKNGINFKKLYEGWRKIATTRIDLARAFLSKLEDSHDR